MTPELHREYLQPGEDEVFKRMIKLTLDQMEPIEGRLRRGQHAKSTGCVSAEFKIRSDIPAHLRHGMLGGDPDRPFKALVRFSNSQGVFDPDGKGTARGLAIKLLDVTGARALPDDRDRTQDFLLVNHPRFPFPNPEAYVQTMSLKSIPLVGNILTAGHLALLERDELAIIQDIRAKRVASPLEATYWSGSPYWLGPADGKGGHAVKYSALPVPSKTPSEPPFDPDDLPDDYLRQALAKHLKTQEAVFEFRVQVQTDPLAMPVEDVAVEWDENVSPPIAVATLRIGPQHVAASSAGEQCESMAFNPWHALAEHRPMGGINRLRKAVYQASFAKRQPR